MSKIFLVITIFLTLDHLTSHAQVVIGNENVNPEPSAIFQMESDSSGFLPPRMSIDQMVALENTPEEGMIVYCSSESINALALWNGSQWADLGGKPFYKVGEKRDGGLVFYVYPDGLRALIADTNNLHLTICDWGCDRFWGATHTGIGYGIVNTSLLHYCDECLPVDYCSNLIWGVQGGIIYDDWFLPSKDELFEFMTLVPWSNLWSSTQSPVMGTVIKSIYDEDGVFYGFEFFDNWNWWCTWPPCDSYVRCVRDTHPIFPCEIPIPPDAGPNQIDIQGLSATLQGNEYPVGSGEWSFLINTGGGIIEEPSNPASQFTGLQGHTYVLIWTHSTECASLSDHVTISFACPTAVAGPDQLGIEGNSTALQATVPFAGTGLWTIIQGNEGYIQVPDDPASSFSGISGETYILRWAISAEYCTDSEDDVTIRFQ